MFKRIIWLVIGTLSCALGFLGVILPGLPTTPFLLLTIYAYSKGSTRFYAWFVHSKLYTKHLKSFHRQKCITKKQKAILMVWSDFVVFISFVTLDNILVRVGLILLVIAKYGYFNRYITIMDVHKEKNWDENDRVNETATLRKIKWS